MKMYFKLNILGGNNTVEVNKNRWQARDIVSEATRDNTATHSSSAFVRMTYARCEIWPLEMSHQVSQGLIVGWRQQQQTVMDGLQARLSILQFCGVKV